MLEWDSYYKQMKERFAPGSFQDPMVELVYLKQRIIMEQYIGPL